MNALSPLNTTRRRPNKYNSMRCVVDGKVFASKLEGRRFAELRTLERAGKIKGLKCQHPFELYAAGMDGKSVKVATYLCDFSYWDNERNKQIFADAKGVKTALFILKAKIVKANYAVDIELI